MTKLTKAEEKWYCTKHGLKHGQKYSSCVSSKSKLNKAQEKRLNQAITKAIEHEAIKFANSQIAFNALRQGTGGYEGETLDIGLRKIFEPLLVSELQLEREKGFQEGFSGANENWKKNILPKMLETQKKELEKEIIGNNWVCVNCGKEGFIVYKGK